MNHKFSIPKKTEIQNVVSGNYRAPSADIEDEHYQLTKSIGRWSRPAPDQVKLPSTFLFISENFTQIFKINLQKKGSEKLKSLGNYPPDLRSNPINSGPDDSASLH